MSILSVAQSQIGIKERPSGSNRVKYSQWYGLIGPWCDMFVSWCANRAGVSNVVGKYAYCPSHVNYFKQKGWWHGAEYKPVPGDIIFFARRGVACHVGIVEHRNGSYSVTTIEGNTSVTSSDNGGAVMRRVRTYGNPYGSWGILGFAHPPYGNGNGKVSTGAARSWLQKGDTGSAVKDLQTKLIAVGYSCGSAGADGDFGDGTLAAVKRFQKDHGLAVDGEAGVNTMAKLNAAYGSRTKSTPAKKASHYDAWIAALQKECNRQGYSRQAVDGVAGPATLAGCPTVKQGARGGITRLIQQRLISLGYPCGRSGADGDFGPGTRAAVRVFQQKRGLAADGIVGRNTWRKLLSTPAKKASHYDAWIAALQAECNRQGYSHQTVDGEAGPNTLRGCPMVKPGARGNITKLIQQRLIAWGYPCGRSGADGVFGTGTRNAVIAFQKKRGLAADGIVGPNTWRKLLWLKF